MSSLARSLVAVLVLAASIGAQAAPEPGGANGNDRAALEAALREEHERQVKLLEENLARWQALTEAEREALRTQMREVMARGADMAERIRANLARFEAMSPSDREALRERVRARLRRERESSAGERARLVERRERVAHLEAPARKRFVYVRTILASLPQDVARRLESLPMPERRAAMHRMLVERGPDLFVEQVTQKMPRVGARLRMATPEERRRIFRAWLAHPGADLGEFLRAHLLGPGGEGRPPRGSGSSGQEPPRRPRREPPRPEGPRPEGPRRDGHGR